MLFVGPRGSVCRNAGISVPMGFKELFRKGRLYSILMR